MHRLLPRSPPIAYQKDAPIRWEDVLSRASMSSTRSSTSNSGPLPFFVSESATPTTSSSKSAGGTLDDIEVSGCDGVEGARNDAALHAGPRSPLVDGDVDPGGSVAACASLRSKPAGHSTGRVAGVLPHDDRTVLKQLIADKCRGQSLDIAPRKSIRRVEQKQRERTSGRRLPRSARARTSPATTRAATRRAEAVEVAPERPNGVTVVLDERDRMAHPRDSASMPERPAAGERVEHGPAAQLRCPAATRATRRAPREPGRWSAESRHPWGPCSVRPR